MNWGWVWRSQATDVKWEIQALVKSGSEDGTTTYELKGPAKHWESYNGLPSDWKILPLAFPAQKIKDLWFGFKRTSRVAVQLMTGMTSVKGEVSTCQSWHPPNVPTDVFACPTLLHLSFAYSWLQRLYANNSIIMETSEDIFLFLYVCMAPSGKARARSMNLLKTLISSNNAYWRCYAWVAKLRSCLSRWPPPMGLEI